MTLGEIAKRQENQWSSKKKNGVEWMLESFSRLRGATRRVARVVAQGEETLQSVRVGRQSLGGPKRGLCNKS